MTLLNTCGFFLATMARDCILLLIHLSYFMIAVYIRLLRIKIINNSTNNKPSESCWKGIKVVLYHLHQASASFGSALSVPILLIIAINFTMASYNLFAIIYGIVKANVLLTKTITGWLVFSAFGCLFNVFIILHAADMPIHQVTLFNQTKLQLLVDDNFFFIFEKDSVFS